MEAELGDVENVVGEEEGRLSSAATASFFATMGSRTFHGQSEDEGFTLDVGISSRAGRSGRVHRSAVRGQQANSPPRRPSNLCFLGGGRAKPAEVRSPPVSLPGRL